MKLSRVTISRSVYIGALGASPGSDIDAKRWGVELEYDKETGFVIAMKGDKVSFIRDWCSADVAEDALDEEDDAGAEQVSARASRRGTRTKKQPAQVSG